MFQGRSKSSLFTRGLGLVLACAVPGVAQPPEDSRLLQRLAEDEARIRSLEAQIVELTRRFPTDSAVSPPEKVSTAAAVALPDARPTPLPNELKADLRSDRAAADQETDTDTSMSHDHAMEIPGGPSLHFRGFFDVNYDKGLAAQTAIYPPVNPGHNTFRTGQFDLFITSQLTPKLSFLAETVFDTGPGNDFGVDIERYQLTYQASRYFEISAGRYHTSIGYYNTAYHHGNWFSTATGRPFMYYFEDSGGMLPVHELGVTTSGYVPGSGKMDLHWTAEIGNGASAPGSSFGDGVQGFASNRSRKDVNFAIYSRPKWIRGLQVGGSYMSGQLAPESQPRVTQNISSVYAVYITTKWEFLNEAVLLHHQNAGGGPTHDSTLAYTQLAYTMGKYRPYFRFQEVNVPYSDSVASFKGRYEGPSFGLRWDVFEYAALKFQYNRVLLRNAMALNGFETQLAFAF